MVREVDKDGKPEIMSTGRPKQEAKVEGRNKAKRNRAGDKQFPEIRGATKTNPCLKVRCSPGAAVR